MIATVVATLAMLPFNVLLPRAFAYVNNYTSTANSGKIRRRRKPGWCHRCHNCLLRTVRVICLPMTLCKRVHDEVPTTLAATSAHDQVSQLTRIFACSWHTWCMMAVCSRCYLRQQAENLLRDARSGRSTLGCWQRLKRVTLCKRDVATTASGTRSFSSDHGAALGEYTVPGHNGPVIVPRGSPSRVVPTYTEVTTTSIGQSW